MKILFVGNSFTYFNDMPKLFQSLAYTIDPSIKVEQLAFGGYYLHQYADFESDKGKLFLEKLHEEEWDVVVLQDQSFNPAKDYEDFFAASKKLCAQIRMIGAKPVFYQTWAYQDGSEKLKSTGLAYDEMYMKLENAYQDAAKQLETIAVPVGRAFYQISKKNSNVSLFISDDYHPSREGSLVAASLFLNFLL